MVNKIFLHATYDCDAHCIQCAVPKDEGNMPLQDFKRIVDVSKSNGVGYIIIGGGEPLMHPDIINMVRYTNRAGIRAKIETNGMLLNTQKLELLKDDLFQMNTSLDGDNAKTHNKIRALDTFDNTVESIKYARKIGIDVAIWSVVMKENIKEVPGIIDLAKNSGVNKISFLYATPIGAGYRNRNRILAEPNEYYDLLRKVKADTKGMQIRIAPYIIPSDKFLEFKTSYAEESSSLGCLIHEKEIIHIDPQGNIFPCVLLLAETGYIMGNAKNAADLSGVLQGKDEYWIKTIYALDKYKERAVKEGHDEPGCIALCVAFGTESDPRFGEGVPVCPVRTITKEWEGLARKT